MLMCITPVARVSGVVLLALGLVSCRGGGDDGSTGPGAAPSPISSPSPAPPPASNPPAAAPAEDSSPAPKVALSLGSSRVTEGGSTTLILSLDRASDREITVSLAATGSASAGSDYPQPPSLRIPAGQTRLTTRLDLPNDTLDEDDEIVDVEIASVSNAQEDGVQTARLTIVDDDAAPSVAFVEASRTLAEDGGTLRPLLRLSAASGKAIRVGIAAAAMGSAREGQDYRNLSREVLFAAGSTEASASVELLDDTTDEDSKLLVLSLRDAANATVGSPGDYSLTITDNDALPTLRFSAASQTRPEQAGRVAVTVQLSAASSRDVRVRARWRAMSSADFEDVEPLANSDSEALFIPAGQTSTTLNLNITDDDRDEDTQTFMVGLESPENATLESPTEHALNIDDNDAEPSLRFEQASATVTEPGSTPVAVQLSTASEKTIRVTVAASGSSTASDHDQPASKTLDFTRGQARQSYSVTVLDDALIEADETLVLTLQTPSNATLGATATETITLTDADLPTVRLSASGMQLSEGGAALTLTAQLDHISPRDVQVQLALDGTASSSDYTLSANPVVIAAGAQSASVQLTPVDDAVNEGDETLQVQIASASNATEDGEQAVSLSLIDNDAEPLVVFFPTTTARVPEGDSIGGTKAVNALVRLNRPSSSNITVNIAVGSGSATRGSDHDAAPGVLTIPAGQMEKAYTFNVLADTNEEPDETVALSLSNPSEGRVGDALFTATIVDDDGAHTLTPVDGSALEGDAANRPGLISVRLNKPLGRDLTLTYFNGSTFDGSTTGAFDVTPPGAQSIVLPAGQIEAVVPLQVKGDTEPEADELFTANFDVPAGIAMPDRIATLTIFDDDSAAKTGDPLYPDQWHIKNTGQRRGTPGEDLNAEPVFLRGIKGAGVRVAVVDDAQEIAHPELSPNVVANGGHAYNSTPTLEDDGTDPSPVNPQDGHGTAVSGLIAARDGNVGVRGVAPRAELVGFNLLARNAGAGNTADAWSRDAAKIAVSNNSWTRLIASGDPVTDISMAERAALDFGLVNGNGGRGLNYLFAAGNNGHQDDDTNLRPFVRIYGTMPICAVNEFGKRSYYSTPGASLWVCAPSLGGTAAVTGPDADLDAPGIATIDVTGAGGFNAGMGTNRGGDPVDYFDGSYSKRFSGTSAATPMVAGVVALMLEANPRLTWRDVRLVLAETARKNDPAHAGWTSGNGYHFNHEYGFGVADADAAVVRAMSWTNVGPEIRCASNGGVASTVNVTIPDNMSSGVTLTQNMTGCDIGKIEFVEIFYNDVNDTGSDDGTFMSDLDIQLISPSGSVSQLAKTHLCYDGRASTNAQAPCSTGYTNHFFGSTRHLGEAVNGTWKLVVRDGRLLNSGKVEQWGLRFYGRAQ